MKAEPLAVGKILSERQRFVVPIYQRTYSWTVKDQLTALFAQLVDKAEERLAGGKASFSHYMGALLVIPDADPVFGRIQTFNIVDGQQRLTTFHLLYAALRDIAREHEFSGIAQQISDLLLHGDHVPMQDRANERYKLQPTRYDRPLFRDLIDLDWESIEGKYAEYFYRNGKIKEGASPLPLRAYWYFWDTAEEFIQDGDADASEQERRLLALSTALFEDFRLIVITLAKDDDAQVIFETLNSGGKPLAAMDLVRNDIFHRASQKGEDIEVLMDQRWVTFEQAFWKQEQTQGRIKKPRIDFFLAHTLAAEEGKLISLSELYTEYKQFATEPNKFQSVAEELSTLTRYIPTYRALVDPPSTGPLARLARRLNTFDVSTAYPLAFVVGEASVEPETKERLFDLIASYVIRRAICGLTPKNYNNVFVELSAYLSKHGVSETSFAAAFAEKTGDTTRFPTDSNVIEAIRTREQYGSIPQNRLRLILEEIELAVRDKFTASATLQEGLSIEHVMPQSWTAYWKLPSGALAPADLTTGVHEMMRAEIERREELIHTLGNLTLLTPPGNASGSNSAFGDKLVRLNDSLLKMNAAIAVEPQWDEDAIARRALNMGNIAIKLWPSPATA